MLTFVVILGVWCVCVCVRLYVMHMYKNVCMHNFNVNTFPLPF